MSIVKISDLPAADSPVSPSDVAPVVQSGVTKKAAIDQFGFLPAGANATLRTIQAKLRDSVSFLDFGADPTGSADCSAALLAAVASGAGAIYVPKGTYKLTGTTNFSLVNPLVIYGEGTFSYGGISATGVLWNVEAQGHKFELIGLTFLGNNLKNGGVIVRNSTGMTQVLPDCYIQECTFRNFRANVNSLNNIAFATEGSFNTVYFLNNRVENITRAAGTGNPGSYGTNGSGSFAQYSGGNIYWTRRCFHVGNYYSNISSDDAVGSANNVDFDAFDFFTPDPSNFPNSDNSIKNYAPATCTSSGNTYVNVRGRAIKVQGIAFVSDETVIRNAGYAAYNGSTEINLQWGVGTIKDCSFFYNDYLVNGVVTSPLNPGVGLTSFYQGSHYGEVSPGYVIDGLTVYNGIKSGISYSGINAISGSTIGYAGTHDEILISISNVHVNRNPVSHITSFGFTPTSYGAISMNNISVPKLTDAAVLVNNTNNNVTLSASNIFNLDGIKTPANEVPFIKSTLLGPDRWYGIFTGANNLGFNFRYNNIGDDFQTPMLWGGALTGSPSGYVNGTGGLSVQSGIVNDDEVMTYERRGYFPNRCLIAISTSGAYTAQGLFACGGGGIYLIAAVVGNAFELSTTGVNPDVDGKFNMWFDGNNLKVKNRLGDNISVTMAYLG